MEEYLKGILEKEFEIKKEVINLSEEVERDIEVKFKEIDEVRAYNQLKVIRAMQKNRVSDTHFSGTTGYGYDDLGRGVLEKVYAEVFKAEDALVRCQIVAGTQAIALGMYGNLECGDEILAVTGKPYDTLDEVIGFRGDEAGSLKKYGITYKQVDLFENGDFNFESIKNSINEKTKMIFMQRSKGYTSRPTLSIEKIGEGIKFVKEIKKDVIVLVDNCYGELAEFREPTEVGADLVAGSLIKNLGGGIAPTGGYVVGKKEFVNNAANRLTVPGLGKELGATLGINRLFFQGLFLAPHIVSESIKGAIYCSAIMQKLDFEALPKWDDSRGDIVQSIIFNTKEEVIDFCQGIQKGSPVDAFVTPEPWDMPGYDAKVIMAAGAFIQGSSIELSADAPIKEPYIAYMQGGLVYDHVKIGVMVAVQKMLEKRNNLK